MAAMFVPCNTLLLLAVCLILHAQVATTRDDRATATTEGQFEALVYTPQPQEGAPPLTRRQRQQQRAERRRERSERNRRQREERRQRQQRGRRGGGGGLTETGALPVDMEWVAANLSSLWQTVRHIESSVQDIIQKNNLSFTADLPSLSDECDLEGVDLSECPPKGDRGCRGFHLAEPCSGAGACCCGLCQCQPPKYGPYCECSDHDCQSHDAQLCGGHGRCKCGQCYCEDGYVGEACECATSPHNCTDPHNGLVCNNFGDCQCGHCKCLNGNFGQYCEETTYSAGLCEELKPCVLCSALGKTMPQCSLCAHVTVQRVQHMEPSRKTCRMVHSGCLLQYSYQRAAEGRFDVMVPENLACK